MGGLREWEGVVLERRIIGQIIPENSKEEKRMDCWYKEDFK
jgi:hypothetical protein